MIREFSLPHALFTWGVKDKSEGEGLIGYSKELDENTITEIEDWSDRFDCKN